MQPYQLNLVHMAENRPRPSPQEARPLPTPARIVKHSCYFWHLAQNQVLRPPCTSRWTGAPHALHGCPVRS